MWLFVALAIAIVVLTHWLLTYKYNYWKKRDVPYPAPTPWVGNLGPSITLSKMLGEIYTDMYNYSEFKDCLYVGYYKFQQPAVLLRDIDLIKDILIKNFSSFHDNDIESDEKRDRIFGKNPFVLKGHRWKVVRSQITSAITTGKVKNMFTFMSNVGKNLVEYLNNEPEATGKNGLEAKELAAKFTTDVVAACAFGLDGNSFSDPDSEFRNMGRRMFKPSFWFGLKAVLIFVAPGLSIFLNLKLVPDDVEDWFIGILTEAIKYREKNKIIRNDYLDIMISLKSKPGEYVFTDQDVVAQAMTFYVDGFETSSTVLSFALYEIAKNSEIQDKLRKEIDRVLAKHGEEVTYEAVLDMNYLDMVVSETLRKHPPGMVLVKSCTKTYTLPPPRGEGTGKSVVIEPGTPVAIPLYAIHTDPKFYPDPDKFDPERFTEEAKNSRPKSAYIPFGDGPRMCLGYKFALTQMKAALVSVVRNFELEVNPKTAPILELDRTYIMKGVKGGLWINFNRRYN